MNERDVSYRAIDNNLPAFAIAADLGNITMTQNPFVWSVGYARPFAIYANWTGTMQTRSPYYMHEYVDNEDMIRCFLHDYPNTAARSLSLDEDLTQAAAVISPEYSDLVSLASRQVFGSIDITISKDQSGAW